MEVIEEEQMGGANMTRTTTRITLTTLTSQSVDSVESRKPVGGKARSSNSRLSKKRRRSMKIDAQLQRERVTAEETHKLLLLGPLA